MAKSTPQQKTLQYLKAGFFPLIIREFNDGPDETPMIYREE